MSSSLNRSSRVLKPLSASSVGRVLKHLASFVACEKAGIVVGLSNDEVVHLISKGIRGMSKSCLTAQCNIDAVRMVANGLEILIEGSRRPMSN